MDRTALIFKVLSGEATTHEQNDVTEWKSASIANRGEFNALKILWQYSNANKRFTEEDSFYDGLHAIKKEIDSRKTGTQRLRAVLITTIMATILSAVVYFSNESSYGQHHANAEFLTFNQSGIGEVIMQLEKEYRITIDIPLLLTHCKFTGSFYNHAPEDAIRLIALSLDGHYRKVDNHNYIVYGRSCKE
jgi:ferric-dicitrate binding protein FerR (iron transport regulator)